MRCHFFLCLRIEQSHRSKKESAGGQKLLTGSFFGIPFLLNPDKLLGPDVDLSIRTYNF
jgi:hypothetical protein